MPLSLYQMSINQSIDTKIHVISRFLYFSISSLVSFVRNHRTPLSMCLLATFVFVSSVFMPSDTLQTLKETVVNGYATERPTLEMAAPIAVIPLKAIEKMEQPSLLPILNTVAGVRMEERSPGSFRLSIRGSSIRSPFGVRNVKVYWEGISLTDASGGTYLNLIDLTNVGGIEIIKGPAGSLYGAGTGGVLLLSSRGKSAGNVQQPHEIRSQVLIGSYGTKQVSTGYAVATDKINASLSLSSVESDGYRAHTNLKRNSAQWQGSFYVSPARTIQTLILVGDIAYQTPGGLTAAQMAANRQAARPATPTLPGSIDQKARIEQNQWMIGLAQTYQWNENWENTTSLFSTQSRLRNPFITNYEIRDEQSLGVRSINKYKKNTANWGNIAVVFGIEAQQTYTTSDVYDNVRGEIGKRQTEDEIYARQASVFGQIEWEKGGWVTTLGTSINEQSYQFFRRSSVGTLPQLNVAPGTPVLPRVAILRKMGASKSVYASVSRGLSIPTVGEIIAGYRGELPQNPLRSERGVSYEVGTKGKALQNTLTWEASLYQFFLNDMIVRRVNANGDEFFVNAGTSGQLGMELSTSYQLPLPKNTFLKNMQWNAYYQRMDFRYQQYTLGGTDFAGNFLPSVPKQTAFVGLDVEITKGFYATATMNYVDEIPLNDANTVFANAYTLVWGRIGWRQDWKSFRVNAFVGVDNALNQQYSLGNDTNAFGGRFYNPAPERNYQMGCQIIYKW